MSLLPAFSVQTKATSTVPSPNFLSIKVGNNVVNNYVFTNGTEISIQYSADRFAVDGLLILGTGSGLTLNKTLAKQMNHTFAIDSALKALRYFSYKLNVTGFTQFYVWAWSQNINNGTREAITNFDSSITGNMGYHSLWISDSYRFPEFNNANATRVPGSTLDYQAKLGSVVSIIYRVYDPNNKTFAVLQLADNKTNVYNTSTSFMSVNMTFLRFDSLTNFTYFGYNYTLTRSIVFFSAYNNRGWERSLTNSNTGLVHTLSDYLGFNSTLSTLNSNAFTDIDIPKFNVTAFNTTSDDSLYVRYRTYTNLTTTTPSNWTNVKLNNLTTPKFVNTSFLGKLVATSLVTVYGFNLNFTLNLSQRIEFQPYLKNRNYTQYSQSKTFTIADSRPTTTFITKNGWLTNKFNQTVVFKVTNLKGTVTNTSLIIKLGANVTTINVAGLKNLKTNATDSFLVTKEGNYTLTLFAKNSFNRTRNVTVYFIVDKTAPTGNLTLDTNKSNLNNGKVTIDVTASDKGLVPSNISIMKVSWGDGIVQDVTKLSSVTHQYTRAGDYTILLTVIDRAGNSFNITLNVKVSLPTKTSVNPGPLLLIPIFLAFTSILIILKKRKLQ